MKKNILISVIVPVYKVEKYLSKCVESILNQSYSNLEIILVDDGYQDKYGQICEEYTSKDNRIKVIHKENGGLSDARNYGLNNSTGDYVCFVDSDDFVASDYVEKLLDACIKNNSDISACNFYYINEDGKKWVRKEKKGKIYTSEEAIKDIFSPSQDTEVMTWNKLYKKNLFIENHIEFPKGKIHEDNFTTYKLYDKANKITLISDKLYYYLQRQNSIMSTFNKKRFDILLALEQIEKYFGKNRKFSSELDYNEMTTYFSLLNNMILFNYVGMEKNDIIKKIKSNKKKFLKNKYSNIKRKIMIIVLCLNQYIYEKVIFFLKKQN